MASGASAHINGKGRVVGKVAWEVAFTGAALARSEVASGNGDEGCQCDARQKRTEAVTALRKPFSKEESRNAKRRKQIWFSDQQPAVLHPLQH